MTSDRIYYSHDAEIQAMREMNRWLALFLMVGLGIGAALALLFAPKSGKKVRADITKSMEHSLNNGRDAVEPIVKRVEKEIGDLGKTIGHGLNNGRDIVEPFVKQVEEQLK